MPATFPSHQGLIAPLWRRWPESFNVLALCIGAGVPDAVDGIAGIFRGHLGQWYGHSLLGLFLLGVPLGLVLTWLTLQFGRGLSALAGPDAARAPRLARIADGIRRLNGMSVHDSRLGRLLFVSCSVWIGAFSHLAFDLVSHGKFIWLMPWYENHRCFPDWWYARWWEVPLLGYRSPYPVGPHVLVWIFLSILGIVLLCRPPGRNQGTPHRPDQDG